MEISQLFSSLSANGVSIGLAGDQIRLAGNVATVTEDQKESIKANAKQIADLIRPALQTQSSEPDEEELEREAIQFADSPEAFAKAEEVGRWFEEQTKRNVKDYGWFSRKVSKIDSLLELAEFEVRFRKDLRDFPTYRQIADQVLALVEFERRWLQLSEKNVYDEKQLAGSDSNTSCQPNQTPLYEKGAG
jgi:hypothetical protein